MEQSQQNPTESLYPSQSAEQKALLIKISKVVKCSVCQNQSLFDSNALPAKALRYEIANQILAGKTEAEILKMIFAKNGQASTYHPDFNLGTTLLWCGPIFMVLIALMIFKKCCQ